MLACHPSLAYLTTLGAAPYTHIINQESWNMRRIKNFMDKVGSVNKPSPQLPQSHKNQQYEYTVLTQRIRKVVFENEPPVKTRNITSLMLFTFAAIITIASIFLFANNGKNIKKIIKKSDDEKIEYANAEDIKGKLQKKKELIFPYHPYFFSELSSYSPLISKKNSSDRCEYFRKILGINPEIIPSGKTSSRCIALVDNLNNERSIFFQIDFDSMGYVLNIRVKFNNFNGYSEQGYLLALKYLQDVGGIRADILDDIFEKLNKNEYKRNFNYKYGDFIVSMRPEISDISRTNLIITRLLH